MSKDDQARNDALLRTTRFALKRSDYTKSGKLDPGSPGVLRVIEFIAKHPPEFPRMDQVYAALMVDSESTLKSSPLDWIKCNTQPMDAFFFNDVLNHFKMSSPSVRNAHRKKFLDHMDQHLSLPGFLENCPLQAKILSMDLLNMSGGTAIFERHRDVLMPSLLGHLKTLRSIDVDLVSRQINLHPTLLPYLAEHLTAKEAGITYSRLLGYGSDFFKKHAGYLHQAGHSVTNVTHYIASHLDPITLTEMNTAGLLDFHTKRNEILVSLLDALAPVSLARLMKATKEEVAVVVNRRTGGRSHNQRNLQQLRKAYGISEDRPPIEPEQPKKDASADRTEKDVPADRAEQLYAVLAASTRTLRSKQVCRQ